MPRQYTVEYKGQTIPFEAPDDATQEVLRKAAAKALQDAGQQRFAPPVLEARLRKYMARSTGELKATPSTQSTRWADRATAGLEAAGLDPREARRLGNKLVQGATDLTPFGTAIMADEATQNIEQGNYGTGAGLGVLSALAAAPGGSVASKEAKAAARALGTMSGAPAAAKGTRGVTRLSEDYLRQVEQGAAGADWYQQSGRSIMEHLGENEPLAVKFTGGLGVTSANTPVLPNLEHAVRAHHQAMNAQPIRAGQFPTAMGQDIEKIYSAPDMSIQQLADATDEPLGPKRTPFAQQNLMYEVNDRSTARAVHDIWDARARGYTAPSGDVFRGRPTAAQHRWADFQDQNYLIPEANRRGLAGRTDWDTGRLQAAAWVGNKIDSLMREGKSFDEAQKIAITDYSHGWDRLYANHSWESAPGSNTGHLAGFDALPWADRLAYHNEAKGALQDYAGRSRIATGYGYPSGGSFDNIGVYEGVTSPGTQDLIPVARGTGTNALDPASVASLDAIASTQGLLGAQKAAAYNYISPAETPLSRATGFSFNLGRGMTVDDVASIGSQIEQHFPGNVGLLPDRNGFRIVQFYPDPSAPPLKDFVEGLRKGPLKGVGMKRSEATTGYIENAWEGSGKYGKDYVDKLLSLDVPDLGKRFDTFAPQVAEKLMKLDERVARRFGLKTSDQIETLRRTIAEKGWNGLVALTRDSKGTMNGGLALALSMAGLGMAAAQASDVK